MLVTVASFTEPGEAHLFRCRLEAEGILATVAHEHHVWAMWPYALALDGVKVQVPAWEREAALAVDARCRAGVYSAELEAEFGPFGTPHCPSCGSARITSRRALPPVTLLIASYLVANVIFPLRSTVHRCRECGGRWSDGPRQQPSPNSG